VLRISDLGLAPVRLALGVSGLILIAHGAVSPGGVKEAISRRSQKLPVTRMIRKVPPGQAQVTHGVGPGLGEVRLRANPQGGLIAFYGFLEVLSPVSNRQIGIRSPQVVLGRRAGKGWVEGPQNPHQS